MTIAVLPTRVAAQIAAGEVVERPASIVKELVENSIDANASRISVAIEDGGTQSMTVSDDGAGIPPDEVKAAFERHATSKLSKVEDLLDIATLGFRGEALPSIAAASRLTCVTKTADHAAAVRYVVEFGVAQRPVQCAAVGTSIRAENLFGYQPARLKFLRTRPTEAAHVQRTVARYAFAHPEIRFSYTSENNVVFQTSGNGKLLDVVLELMGSETTTQMLPMLHLQDDIAVEGYTSNTSLHRSNRNEIASSSTDVPSRTATSRGPSSRPTASPSPRETPAGHRAHHDAATAGDRLKAQQGRQQRRNQRQPVPAAGDGRCVRPDAFDHAAQPGDAAVEHHAVTRRRREPPRGTAPTHVHRARSKHLHPRRRTAGHLHHRPARRPRAGHLRPHRPANR